MPADANKPPISCDDLSIISSSAEALPAIPAILDALPVPVAYTDERGVVLYSNPQWQEQMPSVVVGTDCLAERFGQFRNEKGCDIDVPAYLRDILNGNTDSECVVFASGLADRPLWRRLYLSSWAAQGMHGGVIVQLDAPGIALTEHQLLQLENFDPITGILSRSLFFEHLQLEIQRAQRDGQSLAVFFLDVDKFKRVRETFGYDAGEKLLLDFSHRLGDAVRKRDVIGRVGCDEFAILISDIKSKDDAAIVARKLLEVMNKPFHVDDHAVYCSVHVGVALSPDDASDSEALVREASKAMQCVRETGGGGIQFFTHELDSLTAERVALSNELRTALIRREFEPFYQPKLSCMSGRIVGAEALVRWRHPVKGLVPPCDFIPLMEEMNLIEELGTQVLYAVCRQIREWADEGLEPPRVAVNLSARQFESGALVHHVQEAISATGILPNLLEMELTESVLMDNVHEVTAVLSELRQLGVHLSIDDFGTGYSSLSYLKQFPLDALKIDRSFIRDITADPNDASITRAVINMAHQLKLKVIAEGVETEGQLALLVANHCDEIQGFYFSPPVPANTMGTMLREKRQLPEQVLRPARPQRTLLIVDDEDNIITALRRLLRRDGYRILSSTSAEEGLEILAKHQVDVIISDQRMPGMTGIEFLRRAKTIHPDTIRIVLSGYAELQSVTDAINEGAIYRFLTKPWEGDQIRSHIQEAFRQKELSDENRRLAEELKIANAELARSNKQLNSMLMAVKYRETGTRR